MSTTATNTEQLVASINKKTEALTLQVDISKRLKGGFEGSYVEALPESTKKRFERHGIDLSRGYPQRPPAEKIPIYLDDAEKIRDKPADYIPRGKNADPEKKALFAKVKEVKHLTKNVGTELIGVQLADLNEKELDELALLIAERVVVFFKDQDLSPQKQLEIGHFYGQVESHPLGPRVPAPVDSPDLKDEGLAGTTVIWNDLARKKEGLPQNFKNTRIGTGNFHSDLSHELQPAGITHLHNDAIPSVGGDTIWTSGYAAYDKLSPAFQKFLEGKYAVQRSMHGYLDRNNPLGGPKSIERRHPIIRTHPVTGWKALYVNRSFTTRIDGLEPEESKVILNYLLDVYEKNLDIQVRFNWKSDTGSGLGTSALWDNRVSQHNAVWDYAGEEPRHGTRVTSLAEVPFFDSESKSQREALGLT